MAKRDPERTEKLRVAVGYLLDNGWDSTRTNRAGCQSRLAEHFDASRQRVHQVFVEQRKKREELAVSSSR